MKKDKKISWAGPAYSGAFVGLYALKEREDDFMIC